MTSVQVTSKINIDLNQLLVGVEQLETADLEAFFEQVSLLLAQRKAPSLSAKETELLQEINRGVPTEIQQLYDNLRIKLRSETITSEEHKELLTLVETVEQTDAKRLESLIVLSQLRQISLPELMKQLDIQPPPVHA